MSTLEHPFKSSCESAFFPLGRTLRAAFDARVPTRREGCKPATCKWYGLTPRAENHRTCHVCMPVCLPGACLVREGSCCIPRVMLHRCIVACGIAAQAELATAQKAQAETLSDNSTTTSLSQQVTRRGPAVPQRSPQPRGPHTTTCAHTATHSAHTGHAEPRCTG